MNDREEQVTERRFDWALREVTGTEAPPDVVAAVMARRAGRAPGAAVKVHPMRSWLVAALVLLGLGVVALMAWEAGRDEPRGADEAQDRSYRVVTSLAEIEALPDDVARVELRGLGASALAPLAERLPRLEALRISRYTKRLVGDLLPGLLGAKIREAFPRLQEVDLTGCEFADDDTVAELLALPLLRRMCLGGTAVSDASVPLLIESGQVRELELGEAPWLTMAHAERFFQFGKHVTVRRTGDARWQRQWDALALRYGHLVQRTFYYRVKDLSQLPSLLPGMTHVELRGLGDEAARHLSRLPNLRGVKFVRDDADPLTRRGVELLAAVPTLEEFSIDGVRWDGDGFELLAKLPALRSLRAATVGLTDERLQALRDMPSLTRLELIGERRFGRDGMAAVASCARLQHLDLSGCDAQPDDVLSMVGELKELRALILDGAKGVGDATLRRIGELAKLERLDLKELSFSADAARSLGACARLRQLRLSKNDAFDTAALNAMPVTLVELELRSCAGLDAAAGTILRDRFPELGWLELGGATWLTDGALQAILQVPHLSFLGVSGCSQLTQACFDALVDAAALRKLNAQWVDSFDDAFVERLRELRPDLEVSNRKW